ncbi:phosphotransferase [Jeotgalibacillus sp. R-1-5s-1]|uniref:phosphotransferase n=1 Tax=Jeotgalibacillus sp. R-1-5s-1 TaxID=2555897 RepID=UPI00352A9196
MNHEEKLSGGNVSSVYRAGNTVRRSLKPESSKVHQLLRHLEKKEFTQAPRFLGMDEKGREVLTFIEGEAGNYPLKSYMWSDETLVGIARMLRGYHDAVSDFPIDDSWQPIDCTPEPYEIICHNDFAIYNLIFDQEKPVGVIDFDNAGPGPRQWDVAYALYTCVPLSRLYHTEAGEAVHYLPEDADRIKKRVKLFYEAYGNDKPEQDIINTVILRLEGLCRTMHRKAAEGDPAFQKMIDEGHDKHYQADIQFLREHGVEWV